MNNTHYGTYGGRGIMVCDEWGEDYLAFKQWSINNGYTETLTLDRIDNNKGYFPLNCRWVTRAQQSHNLRACSRSKYGVPGIDMLPSGRYRAAITVNYKRIHIGTFDTLQDAIDARKGAERKYWRNEA